MLDFHQDVWEAARHLLPAAGSPLLVAVSGGADSVVLWDVLLRLRRWPVVAYHLDHGLRAESAGDADSVRALAETFAAAGFPTRVISERADVAALARSWSCGIEAAGRRHRYDRLEQMALELGAATVATAHHRDDQAETVLMNLLRGSGGVGHRGIPGRRALGAVSLIRPLLPFPRARLRAYAVGRGLCWREDASNGDERFRRNLLRKRVLPVLEAAVPGTAAALVALTDQNGDDEIGVDAAVGAVPIAQLPASALARSRVWRRLLTDLGLEPARARIRRLDELTGSGNGHGYRLGAWLFARHRDAIVWESIDAHPCVEEVVIAEAGTFRRGRETLAIAFTSAPRDARSPSGEAWLDADRVRMPLIWRLARAGELWQPLGSPGRQTVRKYLADRTVRTSARASVGVVADHDGIVWIPGFAVAERARVGTACARALHGALGG